MFSSLWTLIENCQFGRLGRLALIVACLSASGCTGWNLRGEPFSQDELTTLPQQFRTTDPDGEAFTFSNKARQIERNLGYR
jgi:hypothetical protein